ncbi:phospholipid/glycerol acyltransferase [Calothrix sp. NIES-4071]|nr:phospholipid/glycerol acyltransferase [Calothrix sp. NIES-4071]BAZ63696.1 phospholipid/glycerol acyltransferase [Calothrix sp. NIES-4105]
MSEEIKSVQPPLKFIVPRFNRFFLQIVRWLLPVLLRFRLRRWLPARIIRVETENTLELAKLYEQFQAGKVRFLLAFRHPEVDDPLSMLYLLSRGVPYSARSSGIKLKEPVHSHFIYERGMTIWAGNWLGEFFSFLGGFPIRRGKRVDKTGLQTARNLFLNSNMPIAVAPEGATNGHSGKVSALEPGVAQLAFWCIEDLKKANRLEEVFIVPVTIQYSYPNPPWKKLDWLLSKLEAMSGLEAISTESSKSKEEIYYQRVLRLASHLLTEMEEFYQRFYHQTLIPINIDSEAANEIIIARLHRLQDIALGVSEQHFGLQAQGTFIDRCRRLEEAGWSYIYRDDLPALETLTPLARGLADFAATEAAKRLQHMRLVESFVAVTATYIKDKPTFERFAETILLMYDMMSRLQNDTFPGRPNLGWRQSKVTVGQPISVTQRWETYKKDRQGARTSVSELTLDLHKALQTMIDQQT